MRIVIKVGTSTLTYSGGRVNIRRFATLSRTVSDIMNAGNEVVLVSSGAIGMGVGKLHLKERPKDIAGKQAAAAVGQCELMYMYDKEFAEHNHTVAQILLTAPDLKCEDRRAKFHDTLEKLLELGVLPIINENDTVATDEIVFGDNDTLAAEVAVSIGADLLILLSDIDGLYTENPKTCREATLIPEVKELTDSIMSLGGGAGSELGTGGMQTKLGAAKIVTEAGCDMVIANGNDPEILYGITDGKPLGTRFLANKRQEE